MTTDKLRYRVTIPGLPPYFTHNELDARMVASKYADSTLERRNDNYSKTYHAIPK